MADTLIPPPRDHVLVVGGAGFIGSHLVALLRHRGHPVRLLDIRPPQTPAEDFCQLDMADLSARPEILAGIDVVYHLAWSTIPQTANLDPGADLQHNLLGSVRLLETCAAAGVRKVIFLSSGGTVYGIPQAIPLAESHPTNPISAYGITKLAVEKYLEMFRRSRGLDYAVVRGANAYGEGQDPARPLGAPGVFLMRQLRGEPIDIWGDGRVVRDYIYVGDLAQALYRCLKYQPPDNGVRLFNAGGGVGVSLLELLEAVGEVSGRPPQVRFHPPRPVDVPVNILDTRRIQAVLGWQPQVSLAQGLARTWTWLQQNFSSPSPGPA